MKAPSILLATAFALLPGAVAAGCNNNPNNIGDCVGGVEYLNTIEGDYLYFKIRLSPGPVDLPCTADGNIWRVARNSPVFGEWFQTLLLATVTDATLVFSSRPSPNPAAACELGNLYYLN